MAGGFEPGSDIRDDISHSGSISDRPEHEQQADDTNQDDSSLLPPQIDLPSSLMEDSIEQSVRPGGRDGDDQPAITNTVLEEQEMHKKLADFESSFLPEPSTLSDQIGGTSSSPHADLISLDSQDTRTTGGVRTKDQSHEAPCLSQANAAHSPTSAGYTTPTDEDRPPSPPDHALPSRIETDRILPNTSALEQMSSSPTAARTVSRVQSLASIGGYETAAEREHPASPTLRRARSADRDLDATPRRDHGLASPSTSGTIRVTVDDFDSAPLNIARRRPQYLSKRSSNARLSYDSMASSTTETSEATLGTGADFALQSGGAASESSRLRRKPNMTLSRSTSLGSLASGVSNMSDDEAVTQKRAAGIAPELSTLEEEAQSPTGLRQSRGRNSHSPAAMVTPRASSMKLSMPTDSVIANHVRDLEVPDTIARKFRTDRSMSPAKSMSMATMTPGPKKGLTLKEHRSTVEKLGKENFDLKMKIHFLDQALQKRSEDGIKEMITENVQLKSDRLRLEKENHGLRKQIRELQRKLDEATGKMGGDDQGYGTDEERSPTVEEEVLYLRERIEMTEIEMEKLRQENMNKESEKRRLAEMVRNLGDSRPGASEVGSREERDMWKDMLEAETIAREQAEDDARKLRDELSKMRSDSSRPSSKLRVIGGQIVSRSSSVDGSKQKADNAELERLRHECSELQKTIGAQASALTSRNKEKEMLYQEIENLKLGRLGGLRSVAGDSIFERSASRARSNSRASNGTRYTRLSDNERDAMENRIDQLRDEVSQLKLEKQSLQTQFDEALADLDAVDAQAQADADQFNEELAVLTQERDNAMRDAEEQDQAFQQLKHEAQEEIDGLGDELDAKIEECSRLEQELKVQADNVNALQAEMRSAAEGLVRLEEDAQQNLTRYQAVKAELDDANRDLESLEKNLREVQSKNERLTVQRESSRNEIAFLREEQDADKIKIGDLESLLKKTHLNLDAERDRAKELEMRLSEERAQRDSIANQEKQEIQRTINELNREASNSKNELRQVRKVLSQREIEVSSFRDRLAQIEDNLKQVLHLPEATSSHLVAAVSKLVRELDQANMELDSTRAHLDEQKKLVAERDLLLEDTGLDNRRLEELVERERQNRRQDKHSFEQALKSHDQTSRIVSQNNARIAELEQARQGHRKQLAEVELQYKNQLAERNQVLLTLWRKLSIMCGPDWAHNHSLINGNLPSQEVIGNILFWPGFSRNLLLSAKQVEGVLAGFKDRIKAIERDLHRNYNSLEREFEARNKKLERIEHHWETIKLREREVQAGLASDHGTRTIRNPDIQKLRNENKLLKAELRLYQDSAAHGIHASHSRSHDRTSIRTESRGSTPSGAAISQHDGYASMDTVSINGVGGIPKRRSSAKMRSSAPQSVTLNRNNSAGALEASSSHAEARPPFSSRNSGFGFTIGNVNPASAIGGAPITSAHRHTASTSTGTGASIEDVRRSLVVPTGPTQYPIHGNFSLPPSTSHSNVPSEGTITRNPSQGKNDEKKWIHRLRELERRLKNEREQRLIDRDGARRRLEERDETNERLKRELEQEKLAKGWRQDREREKEKEEGGYLVADEPMLNEFVVQMQRDEYAQAGGYGEDQASEVTDVSEEDRLMAEAPGVGLNHAQRAALQQQRIGLTHLKGLGSRPESIRSLSKGSMINLSPNRRPESVKEKSGGSIGSSVGRSGSLKDEDKEKWGKNGSEKDLAMGQGVRKMMRTASAMAGVSSVN